MKLRLQLENAMLLENQGLQLVATTGAMVAHLHRTGKKKETLQREVATLEVDLCIPPNQSLKSPELWPHLQDLVRKEQYR